MRGGLPKKSERAMNECKTYAQGWGWITELILTAATREYHRNFRPMNQSNMYERLQEGLSRKTLPADCLPSQGDYLHDPYEHYYPRWLISVGKFEL
jgi:hypothetical protein